MLNRRFVDKVSAMTEPRKRRIIAAYQSGVALRALEQRFGHSTASLRRILEEAGIRIRDRHEQWALG